MNQTVKDPIVIVSMARTPMGAFQGSLSGACATMLGAVAIAEVLERADNVDAALVDEVIMGCVLPAGLGQAPARQAALGAGLAQSAACTTINKMCGSGLKAVMMAHDQILAGTSEIMIAGGMESMTNAPYLLPKARGGQRMGHGEIIDHMFYDGLEDAYDKGKLMGVFAEKCAAHFNFTRQAQDAFAIESITRAQAAIKAGHFASETTPVLIPSRKGDVMVSEDEPPLKARIDKIPNLKPAFQKDGSVTAANASSIADGAAAMMVMRLSQAEKLGLQPLAEILGHTTHAQAPEWFTTAPVFSMKKLAEKTGIALKDVDLFEVNEAFAVVTMAAMKELRLPHEKVNIHGGACAMGHPIGASGARILTTLIAALHTHGLETGMASLCIGGGEASAIAVRKIAS
jgi:acetyl-CoA C-acetyltransferase